MLPAGSSKVRPLQQFVGSSGVQIPLKIHLGDGIDDEAEFMEGYIVSFL